MCPRISVEGSAALAATGLGQQRPRRLAAPVLLWGCACAGLRSCLPLTACRRGSPALCSPQPPAEKTTCNVRVNIQKILGQGDRNPASQGYNAAL